MLCICHSIRTIAYWRRGVVAITTAQIHSTKPELMFCAGSNPACGVSAIRNGEDLWKWFQLEIKLNTFCWSTIRQKQFIIIIIIIIFIIIIIIQLWRSKKRVMGSWNLSHVLLFYCKFYCFETKVLLFIFVNRRQESHNWSFIVDVWSLGSCMKDFLYNRSIFSNYAVDL